MSKNILVTYRPGDEEREIYREVLGNLAQVYYLKEESKSNRSRLLKAAEILVALSFSEKEILIEEMPLLQETRFIQLVYAGADKVPFADIPAGIILAGNVGAFAGPIAEHVLALTLALAKKLVAKNKLLQNGKFDRTGLNREIKGGICGIIGLGGNGREIARIMQAMGMQIYAINRSGQTDAPVDFIGTVDDLRKILQASDVLVLATPLTRATRDMIGKIELEWMKENAILINVGRGDVINQKALYEHLKCHPEFQAGIDTWWSEPAEPGRLKLEFPFFDLPNIIGSPHCADHVQGAMSHATRCALENVRNFLLGKELRGLLNRDDYLG
jgi:phosphoglycerate dehydrogenase-like enzyme